MEGWERVFQARGKTHTKAGRGESRVCSRIGEFRVCWSQRMWGGDEAEKKVELGSSNALGCRLEQPVRLRLVGRVEVSVLVQKGGGGGQLGQAGGGVEEQLSETMDG